MEDLIYLLVGPLGCVLGMAAWMALMARGRRRGADASPGDDVAELRAEVARLRSERTGSDRG